MSVGVRALRGLLSVYRAWSATRPPRCRYVPSCSAYAHEALEVHGAARGSWLAARRVVRCRPGGGLGYDPVPPSDGLAARRLGPRPNHHEHHDHEHHDHEHHDHEEVTRVG